MSVVSLPHVGATQYRYMPTLPLNVDIDCNAGIRVYPHSHRDKHISTHSLPCFSYYATPCNHIYVYIFRYISIPMAYIKIHIYIYVDVDNPPLHPFIRAAIWELRIRLRALGNGILK